MKCIRCEIPGLHTVSALNSREHWRARAKRVKAERAATHWVICARQKPALPCIVIMTRSAPSNGLDCDNLQGAMKAIRDQVAQWLGVDDKHLDIVRYEYAQRRGPWGVTIEFAPMITP